MSWSSALAAAATTDDGFDAPSPESFNLPPIFAAVPWLDKPMLMGTLSVVMIAAFFLVTSRKLALVPGKSQYVGELAYGFVRNSLGRDIIGQRDFMKFVPYLVALFFFILVNNLFGIIPFVQFPTFSGIGWAAALALVSWCVYNGVGIAKHGFFGYLKHSVLPGGVPVWLWPLMIPMEFASNILIRPLTLMLRLFANLFAGHLVLLVFTLGGSYLIVGADSAWFIPAGVAAFGMGVALHFLELLILALQAYIFTVLTASYIAGALAEEH